MTKHSIEKKISFLFIALFPFLYVSTIANISIYKISIPFTFLIIIFLFFKYQKVQIVLIILLYIFLYFVYLLPHFYFGIQLSQYHLHNNTNNLEKVVLLFYCFFSGLLYGTPNRLNETKIVIADYIHLQQNKVLMFMLFFLSLSLIFFILKQGENIFITNNSYQAYKKNLEVINALPVFFVLPLFFLGFSIQNKRKRFLVLIFFITLITYFSITRGTRMILVPYFLLLFLLCFDQKIKNKNIFFLSFIGFTTILVINMLKADIQINANNLFGTGEEYLISHHSDMLYICSAVFGLLGENKIPISLYYKTLIGFILESVIPPSYIPSTMKFPDAIAMLIPNGGGCLFLIAAYLMFGGYIGVFFLGYILAKLIEQVYKKKSSIGITIFCVIIILSPRWISYDFHVILRFSIIAFFIYTFLRINFYKYFLNIYH